MSTRVPGCQNCRQRKIRCDRTANACQNCKKSGWSCPGYAEKDKFRNETAKVRQRARKQEQAIRETANLAIHHEKPYDAPATPSAISTTSSSPSSDGYGNTSMSTAVLLPNSLEELAECYFFSRWVFGDVQKVSDCFLQSIRAVGMARLLREAGPSTSHYAQRQYVKALRHINQALSDTTTAKHDDTLAAVNVLSQVEVNTAFNPTWKAYEAHIQGASALLCLRGDAQFQTPRGGLLFLQTVLRLITLHMTKAVPLPQNLRDIMDKAENILAHPDNAIWQYMKLSIRFADFLMAPSNDAAQGIDDDAAAMLLSPDLSAYTSIMDTRSYTGVARYYRACAMAQIANSILCYRIFLRRICLVSDVTIQDLQAAILESVPQYLSAARAETWSVYQPRGYDPFKRTSNVMRVALGDEAHWSLYFAGFVEPTGSALKAYVISTLQSIGYERGNKHALLLAAQLSGD